MMSLVSKRRKEMVHWAVSNLDAWPSHAELRQADPSEIGCRFVRYEHLGSLPVLECRFGGGCVSSTDFFYAKKKLGVVKNEDGKSL